MKIDTRLINPPAIAMGYLMTAYSYNTTNPFTVSPIARLIYFFFTVISLVTFAVHSEEPREVLRVWSKQILRVFMIVAVIYVFTAYLAGDLTAIARAPEEGRLLISFVFLLISALIVTSADDTDKRKPE